MNELIKFETNQTMTMSSLEIAELCEKEHKHVLVDIDKMLVGLNLPTADFSAVYKANNNQEYRCYNLPKRETLILVSGYSIELRARIIDRWQELENQISTPKLPTNFLEALKLLVVSEEKNLKLLEEGKQKDVKILALTEENDYKEALIDEYEDTLPDEYEHTATAVGKILGVKPNLFMQLLYNLGYIYKIRTDTSRVWTGKAYYQERGWFSNPKQICMDGVRRTTFRITNKGVKELTRHIVKGKIDISDIKI